MNAQELANNKASSIPEIEARHRALFGPTNKSIANKIKDLHTQEILDKLTEPLEQYRDAMSFNTLVSDYFETYTHGINQAGLEEFMSSLTHVVSRDGPLQVLYDRLEVKPRRFDPLGFLRAFAHSYNLPLQQQQQDQDRDQDQDEDEDHYIEAELYITKVPVWDQQYSTFDRFFRNVLTGQVRIDDDHYWTFDDTLNTTSRLVIDDIITQEDKDFIDRILIMERNNWVGRPPAIPPRQPWVRDLQYGQDPQALQASQRAQQQENARRDASWAAASDVARQEAESFEEHQAGKLDRHRYDRSNAMYGMLLASRISQAKQKELRKFLRQQLEDGIISQANYDAYLRQIPPTSN